MFSKGFFLWVVNSLPDMPILGSSNSAAKKKKKRYDVKNMDKWGYNYLTEEKTLWEEEKLLVMSNFSFSHEAVCC